MKLGTGVTGLAWLSLLLAPGTARAELGVMRCEVEADLAGSTEVAADREEGVSGAWSVGSLHSTAPDSWGACDGVGFAPWGGSAIAAVEIGEPPEGRIYRRAVAELQLPLAAGTYRMFAEVSVEGDDIAAARDVSAFVSVCRWDNATGLLACPFLACSSLKFLGCSSLTSVRREPVVVRVADGSNLNVRALVDVESPGTGYYEASWTYALEYLPEPESFVSQAFVLTILTALRRRRLPSRTRLRSTTEAEGDVDRQSGRNRLNDCRRVARGHDEQPSSQHEPGHVRTPINCDMKTA